MIYNDLIKFFNDNIINGIFISVLVVIMVKLFLKRIIDPFYSIKIIKWTLIVYVLMAIIDVVFGIFSIENHALVNRATGPYWWAYWFMLIAHLILPLSLFHKKLGSKIYFILTISIFMNIGWLFESFVIHLTSLHRDYNSDRTALLPFNREIFIILRGLSFGFMAIIAGIIIKALQRNKKLEGNKYA